MNSFYVTTSIPYVNAEPHIGHALEFVQADAIARHRRDRGDDVRFLTGTDDNALKNVRAARAAGRDTAAFVSDNGDCFEALAVALDSSNDDFIRTGSDLRHRLGVEALWRCCRDKGDIYRSTYDGLYCVGCEHFLTEADLVDGRCPEHAAAPEYVLEDNYFFRLSRYQDQLLRLLTDGTVEIEPVARRNEVIRFVEAGLDDLSISRSARRAAGWGIRVPDDDSHVVYVWFDALCNYLSALGFGGPDDDSFHQRWNRDSRVEHVVGKGIVRFHAVYWLAILLSADLPLPHRIDVHEYLSVDGEKISKSSGNVVNPVDVVGRFGVDPLRWWLLADVARRGDTDYTDERLVTHWNRTIVGGVGNTVNRVVTLVHLCSAGIVPRPGCRNGPAVGLVEESRGLAARVEVAFERFDFKQAFGYITSTVGEVNRLLDSTQPWKLNKSSDADDRELLLDVLAACVEALHSVAHQLRPFVPVSAADITAQLSADESARLTDPTPLFAPLVT